MNHILKNFPQLRLPQIRAQIGLKFAAAMTCLLLGLTATAIGQQAHNNPPPKATTSSSQTNTQQDAYTTTVGMPARIVDLILPGTPLEVVPIERDASVVVRILQTIGHGDQNRYELEYYCMEPGRYNLADFLRRIDGSATDDLPAINVMIKAQLASGQVKPHPLVSKTTPRVGGYKTWLIIGGLLWLIGLLAILLVGRNKLSPEQEAAKRVSLAERMRPLVEEAMRGELPGEKQAELERMLLTYWRGKLDLNKTDASEAIVTLRNHETAGELLRQLEGWLHMPEGRRQSVDVAELLKPYRNVRADEVENARAPA